MAHTKIEQIPWGIKYLFYTAQKICYFLSHKKLGLHSYFQLKNYPIRDHCHLQLKYYPNQKELYSYGLFYNISHIIYIYILNL